MSFERIGEGLDRPALLRVAGRLRAGGIRVQSVDDDTVLLVRSEDVAAATEILTASDEI